MSDIDSVTVFHLLTISFLLFVVTGDGIGFIKEKPDIAYASGKP